LALPWSPWAPSPPWICPTSIASFETQDVLGKLGVAWMKRFVDGDTRYNQFITKASF
jgi:hypothetical protein